NLLQAMGSKLEVRSVYGKGSDFSFKVEQEVLDWDNIGEYEEMKEKLEAETAAYKESFQAPDAKILVVDDTPLNLTVIRGLLSSTRIHVDTAESGFDALKMAREKKYDMILVDHRMPKMDGIEMLHVLRGDESSRNRYSTCIALTANAISGAKEMYIEAGFDDYLSKPVEASKLEEMLARYLPREKILHSGQEGFIEKKSGGWNGIERRNPPVNSKGAREAIGIWKKIFDLDIVNGIHNCASGEIFLSAIKNFYDSIDEKSDLIEQYKNAENWNDYTVLVHALKSSARLIGAMELSEQAAFLEKCGDEAKLGDKDAVSIINEKTAPLLTLYKSYSQKLASLLGIPTAPQEDSRPQIEQAKLNDALSALKEVVSVFDFDSADAIMAELEKYSMPKDFEEKYKKIKKAVQSVDHTAIMQLLG
ncbi:MAG: response regulator, partial [Treponema sp.]|nr:response regulator [Treponema sp.]